MDLNETARTALKISLQRRDNGAFGKNRDVLKHAAGELAEAIVAREKLYYSIGKSTLFDEVSETDKQHEALGEELADVIICILVQAAINQINIEKAVIDKMEKNRLRAEKQGDKL